MNPHHLSEQALERELEFIQQSPENCGKLELIACRPAENQRMVLESAELDLEKGLVGDNWYDRGSSKTKDGSAHPDKQLNIMNARAIKIIAGDKNRWAQAGDQLYIDLNLSSKNLPPGTQLKIGSAIIEITALPHNGCKKFAQRFGVDAVKFVNSNIGKELHLRGLNAKVARTGKITTGDMITIHRRAHINT